MIGVHRTRCGVEGSHVARRIARQTDLSQSEIQNLGMASLGHENVGGLDVAMNNPLGMCGIEGVGDFDG